MSVHSIAIIVSTGTGIVEGGAIEVSLHATRESCQGMRSLLSCAKPSMPV